jgi:hypothetical protein
MPIVGECDICLKERELRRVIAYGIETYACGECLGEDPDPDDSTDDSTDDESASRTGLSAHPWTENKKEPSP